MQHNSRSIFNAKNVILYAIFSLELSRRSTETSGQRLTASSLAMRRINDRRPPCHTHTQPKLSRCYYYYYYYYTYLLRAACVILLHSWPTQPSPVGAGHAFVPWPQHYACVFSTKRTVHRLCMFECVCVCVVIIIMIWSHSHSVRISENRGPDPNTFSFSSSTSSSSSSSSFVLFSIDWSWYEGGEDVVVLLWVCLFFMYIVCVYESDKRVWCWCYGLCFCNLWPWVHWKNEAKFGL